MECDFEHVGRQVVGGDWHWNAVWENFTRVGGTAPADTACAFPFTSDGVTHNECADFTTADGRASSWCPTWAYTTMNSTDDWTAFSWGECKERLDYTLTCPTSRGRVLVSVPTLVVPTASAAIPIPLC